MTHSATDTDVPPRAGLSLGLMVLTVLVGGVVAAVLATVTSQVTPVYEDLGQKLPIITAWYLRFGTGLAALVPVVACFGFAFAVMRHRPHRTVSVGVVALALSALIATGGVYALPMPLVNALTF